MALKWNRPALISVYQTLLLGEMQIKAVGTFIELFLDRPHSTSSIAYRERNSQSGWKVGLEATTAAHTFLEKLLKIVPQQSGTRPDGWKIPYAAVKDLQFLICFDWKVLSRAVQWGLGFPLLLDPEAVNILEGASSDIAGRGLDVVFTLQLGWGDLGEDPSGNAHPPLLTVTLGIWGYRPASHELAPPLQAGEAGSLAELNSADLVKVLQTVFYKKLEGLIFELKSRAGLSLGYSKVALFDVQPPVYLVANLVGVRERSTLTSLLNSEDDFDMALQEILQGGETFGSELEGGWLFFRKQLVRLNEKKARSLSLFVPRVDLTSSGDGAKFDNQFYFLANELSYDEFWIVNKANDARGILASVAYERKASREAGMRPSLSKLRNWRERAKIAMDYFRQSMGRVEHRLASWSFDQIPGLPDAKSSFLEGTIAVKYFEKAFGEVESDLAIELEEKTASDSYNLERAVYRLTYTAIIGGFVLAVLPFLLEKEWQLTSLQWNTIVVSGAILLLILAVLAVLDLRRNA